MSDWLVLVAFGLVVIIALIYRQDASRGAARRAEQYENWGIAQTKVLDILSATERLLKEQQNANKILESHNAALTERITAIEAQLKSVTAELKIVRQQLETMTKRAITAEEADRDE